MTEQPWSQAVCKNKSFMSSVSRAYVSSGEPCKRQHADARALRGPWGGRQGGRWMDQESHGKIPVGFLPATGAAEFGEGTELLSPQLLSAAGIVRTVSCGPSANARATEAQGDVCPYPPPHSRPPQPVPLGSMLPGSRL